MLSIFEQRAIKLGMLNYRLHKQQTRRFYTGIDRIKGKQQPSNNIFQGRGHSGHEPLSLKHINAGHFS